jgi:hypothetical protein
MDEYSKKLIADTQTETDAKRTELEAKQKAQMDQLDKIPRTRKVRRRREEDGAS